jgi:hypothetical protein
LEHEVRFRRIGDQFEEVSGLQSREKLVISTIGIAAEGFWEQSTIRPCVGNEDSSG